MSMKIGILAWTDFAFRKIFGKPGNEICLISLLNAVLQLPRPVVSVEYLNPFGYNDFETDRIGLCRREGDRLNGSWLNGRAAWFWQTQSRFTRSNLRSTIEFWVKFVERASLSKIRDLLPGLEFLRATGELNAIREITKEKQMYDATEKASLDIESNLIDPKQEGIEIGEQRGKLIGSVQVYEGLLGGSSSSDDDLSKRSTEELSTMVVLLQKRLRDRG